MNTPNDFSKKHPYDSVYQKDENEVVARNIMVILSRTGNNWRRLSWDEYNAERLNDGNFTESEREFFTQSVEYTYSEGVTRQFSENWR